MRPLSQEDLLKDLDPSNHDVEAPILNDFNPIRTLIDADSTKKIMERHKEMCQDYKEAVVYDYIRLNYENGVPLKVILANVEDWIEAYYTAKEKVLKLFGNEG